jgi:hypothetical protein
MEESAFRIVITVAVALACIAFLVQAGVALALYKVARALQAKVNGTLEQVSPMIDTSKQMLAENRPKVAEITQNVVQISANAAEVSRSARDQVARIGDVVRDGSARAKVRVAQLDESIDTGIQKAEEAGVAARAAAMKPVVQAQGLMAAVRAAMTAYANHNRRSSIEHATQDEEMFI